MSARIVHMLYKNMDLANMNNNTKRTYKSSIRDFSNFCDREGIKPRHFKKDPIGAVQFYADKLVSCGYSPSTIHTRIAAICKGLGISERLIRRPKRISKSITRSRLKVNKQGMLEEQSEKYRRVVTLQRALGIRRAELGKLRDTDLCLDESNQLCIRVAKGKGGKEQYQRILPQYIEVVQSFFCDIPPNTMLFTKSEMSNHLDFHSMRRHIAQEAYSYYTSQKGEARKELAHELLVRYARFHGNDYDKALAWLKQALLVGHGRYILRSYNREKAIAQNQPIILDRFAILCTSVFHLSHWRLDVTVTNYLI